MNKVDQGKIKEEARRLLAGINNVIGVEGKDERDVVLLIQSALLSVANNEYVRNRKIINDLERRINRLLRK